MSRSTTPTHAQVMETIALHMGWQPGLIEAADAVLALYDHQPETTTEWAVQARNGTILHRANADDAHAFAHARNTATHPEHWTVITRQATPWTETDR